MPDALVRISKLSKVFERDNEKVTALEECSLDIAKGEFLALMGPSGSGKSTLLNIIAGIDRPTTGDVEVDGIRIASMSDRELAHWRNNHIGFVFQSFNLIPVLTAFENVELPLLLTRLSKSERHDHVTTALRLVGLQDRMKHYPRQLSGGRSSGLPSPERLSPIPHFSLPTSPREISMPTRPRRS